MARDAAESEDGAPAPAGAARPLSPHLGIYRPQLTSVLSILHRASGIVLAAGLPVLSLWLAAAALGPGPHGAARAAAASPPGLLLLLGWTLAFWYHLCNGIRHLAWDAGSGLELPAVYRSGAVAVAAALLLTAASWGLGLLLAGGGLR